MRSGHAQDPAADAAHRWRTGDESAIVAEFTGLLSIPNIASHSVNIRRNADAVMQILENRGVTTRLLQTPGAPPVVYGEIQTPQATGTLVF